MTNKKIFLSDLIKDAGQQLRQDFEEIKNNNPHAGESGSETEIILKDFLKDHLPRRFDIETGFIVGSDGTVSKQSDLIIFDALNCPVYRKGPKTFILPRDNVAAIIEVKSKLNKDELNDAAEKISSVKQIMPSPITNADQPVTFSNLINTNIFGCVFAFDSYTTLTTLAENLREINSAYESQNWIDLIVVIDKGIIGYAIQTPFGNHYPGWLGGACGDEFSVPPYYVHLAVNEPGTLTLNNFFVRLIGHLTFFRKRSTIDFASILGADPSQMILIEGYQYNLNKKLVPAEESHRRETFKNPRIRFNFYSKKERTILGQVSLLPWQDGAVIMCSVRFDPRIIFEHYFRSMKLNGIWVRGGAENDNIWLSSVLPIAEGAFIKYSKNIDKKLIVIRDTDDDNPPAVRI